MPRALHGPLGQRAVAGITAVLRSWLEELQATGGYRGLVVLHSVSPVYAGSLLARILRDVYGDVLCVAPHEARKPLRGDCSRLESLGAIDRLLGTENSSVVLVVPRLLRPNLLAAAAETVRGGGVVALAVPPLGEWRPGGDESIGAYRRYLVNRLGTARALFWADYDAGIVYRQALPSGRAQAPPGPEGYRARSPVHRRLLEAAATLDQARALDEIVLHIRRRGRSVLVTGDRGRGKSGLLGLVAAYLAASHMVGFVPVTAPSPGSVQGFFRVLDAALARLGVRYWTIERGGLVLGVAGPWFHFRYHTPDRVEPGAFTIVDEAAALGPMRLRRLASRSPRLLAATTIHGYEGSGRVLAKIVEAILPEPRLVVGLEYPVRYPPGDPLEEWLYETFVLRAEVPPPPRWPPGRLEALELDRVRLADDYTLLSRIYGILVQAHYRNEPDDLALILDAPHHRLYALLADGTPVAVADASLEDWGTAYEARIMPDLLAQASPSANRTRGMRVVRIAVHPGLQRRGLGTRLLRHVEEQARGMELDWLGAVFGQPDVLGFWRRNCFYVVYVSPLPSKATGEHNIAVAKPLSGLGEEVVLTAARDTLRKLLLAGHSLYRGLTAEAYTAVLEGAPELAQQPLAGLTEEQQHRLSRALEGQLDVEAVLDVLWLLLVNHVLTSGGLREPFEEKDRWIVAARVLQGKTMSDIAAGLHISLQEARESLRRVLEQLAAIQHL
ncbi:MAG TPA: tRNA(Met) cytidine acetyltransferase [Pyrodictium delaneyi]|uniref:tRNA(Met) cytidine acetyltransferase TmcA n=1 Tax=Pyrodictium delaneyi TaxID=1273541 RepID=A0A833A1X2_9CREN|nr:tRNA(Met) cytidine acetyltransferase [Pyrodictium delaneyi]